MTNIPDLIRRLQRAVSDGTALGCFVAPVIEATDLMEEAAEELAVLLAKTQPCKTCQWWGSTYASTLPTGWKVCMFTWSTDGEADQADTLAYATDGDGYRDPSLNDDCNSRLGVLNTHETFGCCMHQPRETTP